MLDKNSELRADGILLKQLAQLDLMLAQSPDSWTHMRSESGHEASSTNIRELACKEDLQVQLLRELDVGIEVVNDASGTIVTGG